MEDRSKDILKRLKACLKKERPVEIGLPGNGLLKIEKPVPFLILHRVFQSEKDSFPGRLVKSESSFLIVEENDEDLTRVIIENIASFCADKFKGFLLLEVWAGKRRLYRDYCR